MDERLRVGIIACGEVTQILHLPSLVQLSEQFEVAALGDVSRTVLAGVGERRSTFWTLRRRVGA